MWDWTSVLKMTKQNSDECRIREQPELLGGSPPSGEFSSLLSKRAEPREISKLKTKRIEPQIRACVPRPTSCRWKCRSTSFVNIPKIPRAEKCLRFNPLSATRECTALMVRCVRWSLRTRGLKDKTEFMRKRTRWITSSKEIAEVLRGDGRWET